MPAGVNLQVISSFDGGLLAVDDVAFEGTTGLYLVTASGTEKIKPCTSGGGAVSSDRSRVAWVATYCPESGTASAQTVFLRESDGSTRSWVVGSVRDGLMTAAGILGTQVVVNRGFDRGAFLSGPDRSAREIPGVVAVVSSNEAMGTVAAALSSSGSGVIDPVTGDLEFAVDNKRFLGAFSPDGALIVAHGSVKATRNTIWILDSSTGEVRASFTGPSGYTIGGGPRGTAVWEDSAHILVTARAGSKKVVLRLGLDGRVETASETVSPRDLQYLVP